MRENWRHYVGVANPRSQPAARHEVPPRSAVQLAPADFGVRRFFAAVLKGKGTSRGALSDSAVNAGFLELQSKPDDLLGGIPDQRVDAVVLAGVATMSVRPPAPERFRPLLLLLAEPVQDVVGADAQDFVELAHVRPPLSSARAARTENAAAATRETWPFPMALRRSTRAATP